MELSKSWKEVIKVAAEVSSSGWNCVVAWSPAAIWWTHVVEARCRTPRASWARCRRAGARRRGPAAAPRCGMAGELRPLCDPLYAPLSAPRCVPLSAPPPAPAAALLAARRAPPLAAALAVPLLPLLSGEHFRLALSLCSRWTNEIEFINLHKKK